MTGLNPRSSFFFSVLSNHGFSALPMSLEGHHTSAFLSTVLNPVLFKMTQMYGTGLFMVLVHTVRYVSLESQIKLFKSILIGKLFLTH